MDYVQPRNRKVTCLSWEVFYLFGDGVILNEMYIFEWPLFLLLLMTKILNIRLLKQVSFVYSIDTFSHIQSSLKELCQIMGRKPPVDEHKWYKNASTKKGQDWWSLGVSLYSYGGPGWKSQKKKLFARFDEDKGVKQRLSEEKIIIPRISSSHPSVD